MFILQVNAKKKVGVEFTNLPDGTDPGNMTWSTSNAAVATVAADATSNQRADITGVSAGAATITATPSNTGVPAATFTVTVIATGPHAHIQVVEGI